MKTKPYDSAAVFKVHLTDLINDSERTDSLTAAAAAYFISILSLARGEAATAKLEAQQVASSIGQLTVSPVIAAQTFGYHPLGDGRVAHAKPVEAAVRPEAAAGGV